MAPMHPLSLQLYSARHVPTVAEQLASAERHGFTNVETFGPFYDDVAETKRQLGQHGLTAKSGHFGLAMAEQQPDRVVEIAKALGMDWVVIPFLPVEDRPADAAGWAAVGQRLGALSQRLGRERLRVAWHNHAFEFSPLDDASLPIEHLLGKHLNWEADLAWVVKGGGDPKPWIQRFRGRIPLVHVKDIAPAGDKPEEDGWADVGTGTLEWAELWHLCAAAGSDVMIAEHDNPSDFDRFARVSAEAMRRLSADDAS